MFQFLIAWTTFLLLLGAPVSATVLDGAAIIKQVEAKMNGKTAFLKMSMTVKTRRIERTLKMESYSIGTEKSFIKILYPHKDRGITFLKLDNAMWQYIPRIEKTLKIPASMMLQNWMGSDFSNDDLVRESSISEDYLVEKLLENQESYEIWLKPHEDAPVVWGGIMMTISKKYLLPLRVEYFDEDNQLVRVLSYYDIKKFGDQDYPSRWVMEPKSDTKSGHQTSIGISDAVFDQEIDQKYFTKRALKRFSR